MQQQQPLVASCLGQLRQMHPWELLLSLLLAMMQPRAGRQMLALLLPAAAAAAAGGGGAAAATPAATKVLAVATQSVHPLPVWSLSQVQGYHCRPFSHRE
jgi:hypothetical protein